MSIMKNVKITFAELKDKDSIKKILSKLSLPYEDISDHIGNFLLASIDNVPVGVIGI